MKIILFLTAFLFFGAAGSQPATSFPENPVPPTEATAASAFLPCVDQIPGSYSWNSPYKVHNNCDHRVVAQLNQKICTGPNAGGTTPSQDFAVAAYSDGSPGAFQCGWNILGEHP